MKYLPPDATYCKNYARMLHLRMLKTKVDIRQIARSMSLNEDYLREIVGSQPHDKGAKK